MTGTTGTGTKPTTATRWRQLVGPPIAAAGVVTPAACGAGASGSGTSGSGTTSTGSTGTSTAGVRMQALRSCLSENGVTMPSSGAGGTGGTGGGTPPSGGAAPTGAPPAGGQGGSGRPGRGPALGGQAPPGVDAATWTKAQKACAQYLPSGAVSSTNGA